MPYLTSNEIKLMMTIPCSNFIETGTFMGDTTNIAKTMFDTVHTIEIKNDFFLNAKLRFQHDSNVICHLGDSSIILSNICKTLNKPSCFWLDGHYSAGDTGKGIKNVPLYEELMIIMTECKQACVILIDDCRLFEQTGKDLDGWESINKQTILKIVDSRMESYSFFPSKLNPLDRMSIVLKNI
jgi:hypothetical protein